jgi:homospermidine synthase
MNEKKHVRFQGRLVIVGFGSVGQGTLPLLLRHIDMPLDRISILTGDTRGIEEAKHFGIKFTVKPLTRENYKLVLEPLLKRGDFLLNLSVEVSSVDLIEFCSKRGVMYLDTCIEPWLGGYYDTSVSASRRSNYGLREEVLGLRAKNSVGGSTIIPTHGANPGLISHWVKQGLINLSRDIRKRAAKPETREDWARLSMELGVKTIHCSERDTQVAIPGKRRLEFVNTWSVDGFVGEGSQPCELGWGSHERHFPVDGNRYDFGRKSSIYLSRPGAATRVRTWTPKAGPFHGFAITHGESISIADYLSISKGSVSKGDEVLYRPTVHYAYHPCDDAVLSVHEFVGRNFVMQSTQRILMDEISPGGIDELGVLLAGHSRNAYWYGSQLSIDEARELCPYNNATSLQVTSALMSGVVWAMENPNCGIVEPDEMDFRRVMEIARPYLGRMVGAYSDWTPLVDRGVLFTEALDTGCPWQFSNFRVV